MRKNDKKKRKSQGKKKKQGEGNRTRGKDKNVFAIAQVKRNPLRLKVTARCQAAPTYFRFQIDTERTVQLGAMRVTQFAMQGSPQLLLVWYFGTTVKSRRTDTAPWAATLYHVSFCIILSEKGMNCNISTLFDLFIFL